MTCGENYVYVDLALWCVAIVLEFETMMMVRVCLVRIISGCDSEWDQAEGGAFEVDECLQSGSGLRGLEKELDPSIFEGAWLTSLLFAIQLLMMSAESESAATFFPTVCAHSGMLLTTPMSGPKSCLDSFLVVLSSVVRLTTTAPF